MLENIYTTKMSAEGKTLQNRFSKIRSKSGRFSKIMALIMTLVLMASTLLATVTIAALDVETEELITLYSDGEVLSLNNKPFIKDNMTYFPLREMFEKLGVFDVPGNRLEWDNGEIHLVVKEQAESKPTFYTVTINSTMIHVSHGEENADNEVVIAAVSPALEYPALLVNGKTYVPYTFIDYMLNRGLGITNLELFEFLFIVNAEPKTAFLSQGFRWPSEGHISSGFGTRVHPITGETKSHNGVCIAAPEGANVQSAIYGTVTETGFDNSRGNYIIIECNNVITAYHHLSEISVSQGDKVFSGKIIGKTGRTGSVTGPTLHFEVAINGEFFDPERIG